MKIKSAYIRSIFIFLLVLLLFITASPKLSVSGNLYNDAWVLEYQNMVQTDSADNYVPTLYKNDSAFSNSRRFPLVVQNNIHYVPIELFLSVADVSLTYGYSATFFYLAREDGSRYISFDVENNMVTTHDLKTYSLETKIFYNTRYLPAKEVASVLGIKLEIYDDPIQSVYALRVSDSNAKLSFSELIKMYAPIKKDETTQPDKDEDSDGSDDIPDQDIPDIPDNPVVVPDKDDDNVPVPDIGYRNIYLSMDFNSAVINNLTDILSCVEQEFGEKACTFFVSADNILKYPDEIRQILTYGQNIGFLLSSDSLNEELMEAKENLRLVSKSSTRLVRFSMGSRNVPLTDEEYTAFVEGNGLCVWDYNISVGDSSYMYDTVYNELYNLSIKSGTTNAVIRITPGRYTSAALKRLSSLIENKNQLALISKDETSNPFVYSKTLN